ncbi:MAG: DNA repair protein RecO [Bacteroidales bacterium]|nr:DNA repair protein RecO [Bacteroidales bacterium]MBN2817429.1 DNA repair protein RecO [Bacteroidales bacterium]
MLHKTTGIVLQAIKFSDSSLIVQIYTRDSGRQSYIVQGVRAKKSKFHFNQFQPLTVLNLEVEHKESREIQRIRDLSLKHAFHNLHTNIVKNTIALFVAEVLNKSLKDTEGNNSLFDYLESSIQILDICQEGYVNFHLVFMVQFTRFLGIFPQNNLELDSYQSEEEKVKLHDIIPYSLKDLHKLTLTNTTRNLLVKSIVDYYRYHLDGISEIKSIKVLHEVFS